MNCNFKPTGGASIVPSARRGIHDHGDYTFEGNEAMGRYGLASGAAPSSSASPGNLGRDDVDANVLSKHARLPSPVQIRKADERRKSLDLPTAQHTDDSSDGEDFLAKSLPVKFSKSLPAILIPHYSDRPTQKSQNSSASVPSVDNSLQNILERRNPASSNGSSSPKNPQTNQQCQQPFPGQGQFAPKLKAKIHDKETQRISPALILVICIVMAIVGIGIHVYFPRTYNIYDELKFYNELNYLGQQFSASDDSILQVQTGISTIFEKQDAGSFIFIYNSNGKYFDQITFNNFMDSVASATARYLRNESTSVQHIVVDTTKLYMQTHSELINEYREDIAKTGVMLVKELDRVPSVLAMAFHYYCDEYNPLVKRSAIFFTLDMARCSYNLDPQQPTHAYIEKCLTKKWNGVPEDNIGPLLTRVVGTVVDVTSV